EIANLAVIDNNIVSIAAATAWTMSGTIVIDPNNGPCGGSPHSGGRSEREVYPVMAVIATPIPTPQVRVSEGVVEDIACPELHVVIVIIGGQVVVEPGIDLASLVGISYQLLES